MRLVRWTDFGLFSDFYKHAIISHCHPLEDTKYQCVLFITLKENDFTKCKPRIAPVI